MPPSKPFQYVRQLAQRLMQRHWMLAVAESCTGGGLAHALTAIPGASSWFDRGVVTYHNRAKMELLGVSADDLHQHGAVSSPVAVAMAEGLLHRSIATVSLSVTGIAGPTGGSQQKPVGTVYFGMALRNTQSRWQCMHFDGERENIRNCAINFALSWLMKEIND